MTDVVSMTGGQYMSFMMTEDGSLYGMGRQQTRTSGIGVYVKRKTPAQVKGAGGSGFLTNVKDVAMIGEHSVAVVLNDGTLHTGIWYRSTTRTWKQNEL